jgi:hypothetical protein
MVVVLERVSRLLIGCRARSMLDSNVHQIVKKHAQAAGRGVVEAWG